MLVGRDKNERKKENKSSHIAEFGVKDVGPMYIKLGRLNEITKKKGMNVCKSKIGKTTHTHTHRRNK